MGWPVIVLLARPARDRLPTATRWRLIEYDSTTRLPVGDVAARWEPAGSCPPARVNHWVSDWASTVLGHPVRADEPATDLAGPGSWHVLPADTDGRP